MSYRSALILLFCIFAVGCRTDPNRVLQERELRLMEDRIFQLEECVREYQAALAVSERDNLHLRRGLSSSAEPRQGSGSRRLRESPAATPPSNGRAAPRDVDRTGPETAPPSRGPLAPPRVEIDGVDETSPEVPGRSGPSSGSSGPSRDRSERTLPPAGGRIGRNSSSPGAYMPPLEDDAKVAQVTLVKKGSR